MSEAFVWFHNNSDTPSKTLAFYEKLLGWKASDGPSGMKVLARDKGPVAGLGRAEGGAAGWLPFAQVDDVDAATRYAVELGATVVKEKTRGPAGEFSIVRDPGGATLALWQKA